MATLHVKHNDKDIGPIASAAFPRNRKDIVVKPFVGPVNVNSSWEGGSRDEYRIVCLETRRVWPLPASHPHYGRKENGERCGVLEISDLPPNTALVCGGTFLGKSATVRVLLRSDNLTAMLPAPAELSGDEPSALRIIGSIRGGARQDEFSRAGIGSYGAGHPAILSLAEKRLVKVNKAGAVSITTEGRNAIA